MLELSIVLSVITIILLIFILVRFKRLFSTDGIIEKTRAQMNRIIKDINSNANRDIELVNENSRRIKALINELDKKCEKNASDFHQAYDLLRSAIKEADSVAKKNGMQAVYAHNDGLAGIQASQRPNPYVNPDAVYVASSQQNLFDDDEVSVRDDGAAYKQVPVIVTKLYEDMPSAQAGKSAKNLGRKVEKMYLQGYQVEEIATELSCSISEVQFIIDMLK